MTGTADDVRTTASESLIDEAIALALALERLARYISDDITEILKELRETILVLVARRDPTALRYEANRRARLAALVEEAQKAVSDAYVEIAKRTDRHLLDVASLTQDSGNALLSALLVIKGLSKRMDRDALREARDRTLIEGATVRDWWARQSGDLQFRVQRALEGAMLVETLDQQPTLNDLVDAVRSDEPGALFSPIPRNAQGLISSAVHAVATSVRLETAIRHPELFAALQHQSVIDGRTTKVCISRSGKRWSLDGLPIGHSLPFRRPPLHWNSLAAGTQIQTLSGPVPIEQVAPGMMVLTHRGRYRRVLASMSKICETGVVRVIRTESGRVLRATDEHPILTKLCGWKRADQIQVGDQLFEDAEDFHGKELPSVVVSAANNYPPAFHEAQIFDRVRFSAAIMSPTIDFENDLAVGKCEVPYGALNYVLMLKLNAALQEVVEEGPLSGCDVGSPTFRNRFVHSGSRSGVARRIATRHALACPSVKGVIGLVLSVSPVISASFGGARVGCKHAGGLTLASNDDPVSLAPTMKNTFSDTKLFLKSPEGFVFTEVMLRDKNLDSGLVSKVERTHWSLSSVVSIEQERYESEVYNIEVDEDNTYIADGVVVHNCRSHLVPVMHRYADLPPRIQRRVREEDFPARTAREPDLAAWLAAHGMTRSDEPMDFDDARDALGL